MLDSFVPSNISEHVQLYHQTVPPRYRDKCMISRAVSMYADAYNIIKEANLLYAIVDHLDLMSALRLMCLEPELTDPALRKAMSILVYVCYRTNRENYTFIEQIEWIDTQDEDLNFIVMMFDKYDI